MTYLHDTGTGVEIDAERSLLKRLGGSCDIPIGARARMEAEQLKMIGVVASADGKALCRGEVTGSLSDAVALGRRLAEQLLKDGADRLLKLT